MESTYGDRIHERAEGVAKKLIKVVKEAVIKKSKILVPAFSLGRTQEIIYTLHKLTDANKIPRIPIYVDSPLSNRITKVFSGHRHDFDKETWEDFLNKFDAPMTFRNLHYINKVEDSKKLNTLTGPFMIISASGMAEGGRIVHHLMNNIENPNNIILITGYQAVHTLGRKIHSGISPVRIHGQNFQVKAKVLTMNEFSAHADQPGLLTYLASVKGLKNLFLVHGEKEQAESFKTIVESIYPEIKVEVPALGESFEI